MSKIRVVNLVPKMHKKLRCDGDGLKIKNEFEKYVTIILKKIHLWVTNLDIWNFWIVNDTFKKLKSFTQFKIQ